jgi:hypothetical protein
MMTEGERCGTQAVATNGERMKLAKRILEVLRRRPF